MLLEEIVAELPFEEANFDLRLCLGRPVFDSRKVQQGDVFFALCGERDGNDFAGEAVHNGAVCVVTERTFSDLPYMRVKCVRQAFAAYCAAYYGHPEKQVKLIGVTGTNGKTSTVKIISHILGKNNFKTAVIGTLGAVIDGVEIETGMTTPDSDVFFGLLRKAADCRTDYVIAEISAHAVYYDKTYGAVFEYGVFTNLSRDHLDFFKTMEEYGEVKRKWLASEQVKTAVINTDDGFGSEIIKLRPEHTLTYGLNNPADVFALEERYDDGLQFLLNAFDEIGWIMSPLTGKFNLYNVLAAVTVCTDIGVSVDKIAEALITMPPIEGRFNALYGDKYTVIIDYAHTPDGLEKVLVTARGICRNNLICVFGCGGNRDREKRPIMGAIATRLAELVIVTSDNPRDEDPNEIISEIVEGANKNYIPITDRERAIRFALRIASEGDVIVIAGKGAEKYMEIKGVKYPFNDRAICAEIMEIDID